MHSDPHHPDTQLPDAAALLEHYSAAWNALKTEGIARCWNPNRFIFYKAEEIGHFFRGWQQVKEYWRNNEAIHQAVSLQFDEIETVSLGSELAVATTRMRWDIRFADDAKLPDGSAFPHRGQAMGGDNHVVVFFCPDEPGWKICGWSETPDAPITYMRSLYLRMADTNRV